MSFVVLAVSDPFATPVVSETRHSTDHQRLHDEADRRRHQHHPHAETPLPEEPPDPSAEIEPPLALGTLIDLRA